jgi:phosphomannomutase
MSSSKQNPSTLMVSISGVRGIIPVSLNYEVITKYILAFVKVLNPKSIIIARDSRPSGEYIQYITTGILLSLGIDVKIVGIVPTPTLKSIVNETKSSGGIMISASHNPIEWNAFKFVGKDGFFFTTEQVAKLRSFVINEDSLPKPKFFPKYKFEIATRELWELHIDSVLKRINVNKIRKRKFKVFLDAVNGGGSYVVPYFLEKLGCKVIELYTKPDGTFPRPPEPTPKALEKTSKLIKKTEADIGFALDPDADRLVLLSPKKGAISEEYTLPLSLFSALNTNKKNIVINLSTSSLTKIVAEKFKKKTHYAKVGEANVVSEMLRLGAFFGGEGNGGVIDPNISSFGRDSLAGIAHILNHLAEENLSFDAALSKLPELFMSKQTFSIQNKNLSLLFAKLKESFPNASIDEKDGVRFDIEDSWLHIRASNTEPILRIIAESNSKVNLEKLLLKTKERIES